MNPRRLVLLTLLSTPFALAQSGQLVPTSAGEPDPKVLSLREMTIDVGLARGYARVNVRQVFENHTEQVQEGTYRFALAPSAAVGDFAVWDGMVRIPGVILEKARARAIYRSLTTQRIDPGLLQQGEEDDGSGGTRPSGGAVFSVTVAPIPARATKRLELQFQQDVPFVSGQGEFRLALKPTSGETPVAGSLEIRVRSEDASVSAAAGALPLTGAGNEITFSGRAVPLDRDLGVTLRATSGDPLRLAAFRNPDGALPDGLALAPWERPSEIPPEKDGFFLLEVTPPAQATTASTGAPAPGRKPVSLAILFDTSLSHRWLGLEAAYARLVGVLQALTPADRFVLIPFDRKPAADGAPASASPASIEAALAALRARPLGVGTDVVAAVAAARQAIGDGGRILLFTDGAGSGSAKALAAARGALPLFTSVGGGEAGEALRAASAQVLGAASTSLESDLFVERLLAPTPPKADAPRAASGPPFSVTGGEPKLRDMYPVLLQPLAPGALSGWVGRYAVPAPRLEWTLASSLFPGGRASLTAPLPERALEARDLPRRWARARVDYLLALIEAEGERREWIEEVIALSKRYKFVTPYTAFLAAPRSLLRPRRIQPGDPVLRVDCDAGIVSATALFPFGLRLPLVRRPGTTLWEGRFLVPEGLEDGRYDVRVVLRDASGTRLTETKSFVLDGRPPTIRPEAIPDARPGQALRVAVRTDADVIFLSARLGDGAPVPLRWDAAARRSTGTLQVPAGLPAGRQEIVFEAVDGANNHGFARASLELRP
jgi:Ca-activated chloride channel family protein